MYMLYNIYRKTPFHVQEINKYLFNERREGGSSHLRNPRDPNDLQKYTLLLWVTWCHPPKRYFCSSNPLYLTV